MNVVAWVLIDKTNGATTKDGAQLTPSVLAHIAEAVGNQVNNEFAAEWGAQATLRVGANAKDIRPGEWAYVFLPTLPDAPGASAYHDINNKGVPFALCAVTTCGSLYGPNGVSVDVSHEILETAGDQGANLFTNDNKGLLHAMEMCDAVEIQTYGKTCADGTVVQVSNWLLQSWFIPGAPGHYAYMSREGLNGAVSPPGPLMTAPGNGGNYQIVSRDAGARQVFARGVPEPEYKIEGTRRKGPNPNWSSRTGRRMANKAINMGNPSPNGTSRAASIPFVLRGEATKSTDYGSFSGNPKTEWLVDAPSPDRNMQLLADFYYVDPQGAKWPAPEGSIVNGASIPQALWSTIGSPYTDDYRRASIVHDVACQTPSVLRKDADVMFYFACLAGGCGIEQARILYAGVRIGAWAKASIPWRAMPAERVLSRALRDPPAIEDQFCKASSALFPANSRRCPQMLPLPTWTTSLRTIWSFESRPGQSSFSFDWGDA